VRQCQARLRSRPMDDKPWIVHNSDMRTLDRQQLIGELRLSNM